MYCRKDDGKFMVLLLVSSNLLKLYFAFACEENESTVTNRSPIVQPLLKARVQSNVLTWAPDFRSDPSELSVAGAKKAWSGDPNSDRFQIQLNHNGGLYFRYLNHRTFSI